MDMTIGEFLELAKQIIEMLVSLIQDLFAEEEEAETPEA